MNADWLIGAGLGVGKGVERRSTVEHLSLGLRCLETNVLIRFPTFLVGGLKHVVKMMNPTDFEV